jgi:nucleoside-diphosphate-sugar epimerase
MILVVGATGQLGGLIAQRLVARGEAVRIIGHVMAGLDTYDSIVATAATAETFGVKQTNLDQFLLGMLGQGSS